MNITQLYYFKVTAELSNMNMAAQTLHISQPAISRQIKLLEEELDTALFLRNGKKIILTDTGQQILEHIDTILDETAQIQAIASNRAEKMNQYVTVKHFAATATLYAVISEFIKIHPEIHVITHHAKVDDSLTDLVLYPTYNTTEQKNSRILYREEILLAIHRAHPALKGNSVRLRDLRHESFLANTSGDTYARECNYFCSLVGFIPRLVNGYQSSTLRIGAVRSQLGVAFVSTVNASLPEYEDICYARISDVDCSRYMRLLLSQGMQTKKEACDFYNFFVNFCEENIPHEGK